MLGRSALRPLADSGGISPGSGGGAHGRRAEPREVHTGKAGAPGGTRPWGTAPAIFWPCSVPRF